MKKRILMLLLFWLSCFLIFAQKVGLGTLTPAGALHIKGDANISQLIIDANTTQAGPLIRLLNAGGADLLSIDADHESNTCIGLFAGAFNSGAENTFVGSGSGFNNFTGEKNTAAGYQSLYTNGSGSYNTAMGFKALFSNWSTSYNTAIGYLALYWNNGNYNTGCGAYSLFNTSNSSYNVAVGYGAGYTHAYGWNNVFFGAEAEGAAAGQYNMVAFGNIATCTDVSQARISNSFTGSIGGYEDWTNISDGRFKKNVQANVPGLIFINKLRPVTYKLDVAGISDHLHEDRGHAMTAEQLQSISQKEQILQTGFIAQEVELAARSIGYDFSGVDAPRNEHSLYGLRYAEFVVPLVKAIQELKEKLERVKQENVELKELESVILALKGSIENLD